MDKNKLALRSVTGTKQIATVETLAREIWLEHYTPIIGVNQVEYMLECFQTSAAIAGQIRNGCRYYLIEKDGNAIGYVAFEPRASELFLSKLYVRTSERKQGYGRMALACAEAFARRRGLKTIFLTVNRNNTSSIRAYEKMGFAKSASLATDIGGGFTMCDYRMEKKL